MNSRVGHERGADDDEDAENDLEHRATPVV